MEPPHIYNMNPLFRNPLSAPAHLKGGIRFKVKQPGQEVIKLFSCSTTLSTKFQLLMKIKIPKKREVSNLMSHRCGIYHANKC